eukprot:Rhum_TRINITY_DN352_c0_g1::Rhum_TRINITY_DN352_c0_g1_i1::g.1161::m.1161
MVSSLVVSSEGVGLLLVACSALLNSAQNTMVQLAQNKGVSSLHLASMRAVVQGLLLSCYVLLRNEAFLPRRELRFWAACRGLGGALAFVMLFKAVSILPLGDATALFSSYPMFAVIVARIWLGEAISGTVTLATVFSVVGCTLIAQPSFLFDRSSVVSSPDTSWSNSKEMGIACALGTAVCMGVVMVLIRYCKDVTTPQQLLPWCISVGMASFLLSADTPFEAPSRAALPYCVVVVAAGLAGQCLMTVGAKACSPGLSSLMLATEIMWSFASDAVVFGRHPCGLTKIGVGLDIVALALVALEKWSRAKATHQVGLKTVASLAAADEDDVVSLNSAQS